MRRLLQCFLPAGLLVLCGCNAIFGIQGGSLTSDADAGPDAGPDCMTSPFPATPVLDSFDRADGMLGPMWSVDTIGGYQIAGDQLVGNAGTPGIMVWSNVFGPAQEAYVKIVSLDPTDGELELILKNQGMITECDSLEIDYQPQGLGPGQGMLGIYSCTAGNPVTYVSAGFTLAAGDQFGARACADGKVFVFKNGSPVTNIDVSQFAFATAGGRIGFFSSSLTTAAHLDDFGGGTLE